MRVRGTPTLSPQVLEREPYLRFIHLSVYPSIASKGNHRRNEYIKGVEKKGDFEIRDLFDRGMVTKINHGT